MLDLIKSYDPFAHFIDQGLDMLGLPPETQALVKVGLGAYCGNFVMVADGVQDLCQAGMKNEPAKTEYLPPGGEKTPPRGYACGPTQSASGLEQLSGLGGPEIFQLDRAEVLSWIPSDPCFQRDRASFNLSTLAGKGRYLDHLKTMLRNKPAMRAEFEARFGVKLDFSDSTHSRNDELVVRRPAQSPEPAPFLPPPGASCPGLGQGGDSTSSAGR